MRLSGYYISMVPSWSSEARDISRKRIRRGIRTDGTLSKQWVALDQNFVDNGFVYVFIRYEEGNSNSTTSKTGHLSRVTARSDRDTARHWRDDHSFA